MTTMKRQARGVDGKVVDAPLGHCEICGETVWAVRSIEMQRPGNGMYYEFVQGPPYLVPCEHPAAALVPWISWRAPDDLMLRCEHGRLRPCEICDPFVFSRGWRRS